MAFASAAPPIVCFGRTVRMSFASSAFLSQREFEISASPPRNKHTMSYPPHLSATGYGAPQPHEPPAGYVLPYFVPYSSALPPPPTAFYGAVPQQPLLPAFQYGGAAAPHYGHPPAPLLPSPHQHTLPLPAPVFAAPPAPVSADPRFPQQQARSAAPAFSVPAGFASATDLRPAGATPTQQNAPSSRRFSDARPNGPQLVAGGVGADAPRGGALQRAREAQRRQRDDAWQDEQSALADGGALPARVLADRVRDAGAGEADGDLRGVRRVDLAVNVRHRAPFLPDASGAAAADDAADAATGAARHHRALVWPAKDRDGPFAARAIAGSAALKERRTARQQQQSVRARLDAGADPAPGAASADGTARASAAADFAAVEAAQHDKDGDDDEAGGSIMSAATRVRRTTGGAAEASTAPSASSRAMSTSAPETVMTLAPIFRGDSIAATTATGSKGAGVGDGNEADADNAAVAAVDDDRDRDDDDDTDALAAEAARLRAKRETLPIFARRQELLDMVREHRVIIVQGETGCGKTTQLAQYLLEDGFARRDGSSILACTQPRRVAAIGVARRVAAEVGCAVGGTVGYAVRLEDATTQATRLKFVTEGVLLREAVGDPHLWRYSVIVLDEAHERSIDTDLLLGVLKHALHSRRDLRVVIMSATLQVERFAEFFGDRSAPAPIVEIEGRTFPVTIQWAPAPVDDYVQQAVLAAFKAHVDAGAADGDVLIFLTGEEDVRCVCELLRERVDQLEAERSSIAARNAAVARQAVAAAASAAAAAAASGSADDAADAARLAAAASAAVVAAQESAAAVAAQRCLDIVPCFSSILVNKEQLDRVLNPSPPRTVLLPVLPRFGDASSDAAANSDAALAPASVLRQSRKCVVATNVAETSLTIDGVTVVIDCGFMKCKVFQPRTGAHPLLPFPIAQAQATQRAGRAGRTRAGTCIRLYTEGSFRDEMLETPVPEIKRSSVDHVCLLVKAIGFDDVERFAFIDPPPTEIVAKSLYALWLLGAIDDRGTLTARGRQLAALPVEPAMGVALLTARDADCLPEVLGVAAMLSVDTRAVFNAPRDREAEAADKRAQFSDTRSDHLTMLNILVRFAHEVESRGDRAAQRWAHEHFVSYSVLKMAIGIRAQLEQQVGRVLSGRNASATAAAAVVDDDLADLQFRSRADAARFAIVSGFFPQCAQRKGVGEYVTVLAHVAASASPRSVVGASAGAAEFVVFHELTTNTERSFVSVLTVAEPQWLVRASRGLFYIRGQQPPPPLPMVVSAAAAGVGAVPHGHAPGAPASEQSTLAAAALFLQAELSKVAPMPPPPSTSVAVAQAPTPDAPAKFVPRHLRVGKR